jgi:hypothetical protein
MASPPRRGARRRCSRTRLGPARRTVTELPGRTFVRGRGHPSRLKTAAATHLPATDGPAVVRANAPRHAVRTHHAPRDTDVTRIVVLRRSPRGTGRLIVWVADPRARHRGSVLQVRSGGAAAGRPVERQGRRRARTARRRDTRATEHDDRERHDATRDRATAAAVLPQSHVEGRPGCEWQRWLQHKSGSRHSWPLAKQLPPSDGASTGVLAASSIASVASTVVTSVVAAGEHPPASIATTPAATPPRRAALGTLRTSARPIFMSASPSL